MNRFMKKFKAVYCNASFIFAIAVLMVTISLCIFYPDSVNASQSPSPSGDISTNDVTNDLDDVKSLDSGDKDLADATSDSTNGLNIYYNNESGSLSTPVRMFLVLTVLSLAPSILIMLTSFTRISIGSPASLLSSMILPGPKSSISEMDFLVRPSSTVTSRGTSMIKSMFSGW